MFGGTASLITKLAEIGQPWVGEKDAVGFKAFQSATGGAARLLGAPAGKIAWSCKNAAALWPAPQHYQTACEKPGHMLNDKSEDGSPLYVYIYMYIYGMRPIFVNPNSPNTQTIGLSSTLALHSSPRVPMFLTFSGHV